MALLPTFTLSRFAASHFIIDLAAMVFTIEPTVIVLNPGIIHQNGHIRKITRDSVGQ